MKRRNFKHIVGWLVILGVISLLIGVAQLVTSQADTASQPKEHSMNSADKIRTPASALPAIDAAAAVDVETASFGLG